MNNNNAQQTAADAAGANPHLLVCDDVVVDISMLYEVAANDEACIKLMAQTFLNTVPNTLQLIENSYQEKDYEQLRSSAHKMKSAFSIIKVNDMLGWFKEIEQLAKEQSTKPLLAELVNKMSARFLIVQKVLTDKFHKQ